MSKWQEAEQRFGQLQYREKMMLLAVALFCVVYLSVWFGLMPMLQKQADFNKQIAKLDQDIAVTQTQQHALQQALAVDYKGKVLAQIREQQAQVLALDTQLQQLSQGFIAAENMPQVLSGLLAEQSGVQFVSFKVVGTEPVTVAQGDQQQDAVQEQVLYRHNMELKVSGDYFAVQAYLNKIEQAPLQVLITGFHYHVDEYPNGELTLNLATVSSNDTFIVL